MDLHHWLFPQKGLLAKYVLPRGFVNAGFNLVAIPSSINRWAGGILWREALLRYGILGSMGLTGYGSYKGAYGLTDYFLNLLFNSESMYECFDNLEE